MKQLGQLLHYAKPYKGQIVLYFFLMLFSSVFSVVSIGMAIPFLNIIFETGEAPELQESQRLQRAFTVFSEIKARSGPEQALLWLSGVLVALFFVKNVLRYLALRVLTPIRTGIIRDLRAAMFEALLRWPAGRFTQSRKGDLLARMSADVQELEWAVFNSITSLFRDPITIVVTLAAMVALSPKLTLFILILLPISAWIIGRIGRSLKRTAHLGQDELGRLTSITEETVSNIRIIKSFMAEDAVRRRFHQANDRFTALSRRMVNRRELSAPLSEFSGSVVIAIIIWVGGMMVLHRGPGTPDAASFITFIALFSQIITPAKSVATTLYNIQKGRASAARIQEVIDAEKESISTNAPLLPAPKQGIFIENLWHNYGTGPVLRGITLTLPAGCVTALVGPSGAGKSTLADLVAGLIPVQQGTIRWDQHDYQELPPGSVRRSVAMVPQDHALFNESVRFNITMGEDAGDAQRLREACLHAHALEFVDVLPGTYDFIIGEKGGRLSGGQRQRIALARAFYKNAPVLVLDEATAHLDPASEEQVQKALEHLLAGRTALVIAHRLHTVQRAHQIVVLEAGAVVGTGTHQELLDQCPLYGKLAEGALV